MKKSSSTDQTTIDKNSPKEVVRVKARTASLVAFRCFKLSSKYAKELCDALSCVDDNTFVSMLELSITNFKQRCLKKRGIKNG